MPIALANSPNRFAFFAVAAETIEQSIKSGDTTAALAALANMKAAAEQFSAEATTALRK